MLLSNVFRVIGLQLLILTHTGFAMVLLSANFEDIRKVARKFVSDKLADEIVGMITNLTRSVNTNTNVSDENDVANVEQVSAEGNKMSKIAREKQTQYNNPISSQEDTVTTPNVANLAYNSYEEATQPAIQLKFAKKSVPVKEREPIEEEIIINPDKNFDFISIPQSHRDMPKSLFYTTKQQKLAPFQQSKQQALRPKKKRPRFLINNKYSPKQNLEDARELVGIRGQYLNSDKNKLQPRYKFVSALKQEMNDHAKKTVPSLPKVEKIPLNLGPVSYEEPARSPILPSRNIFNFRVTNSTDKLKVTESNDSGTRVRYMATSGPIGLPHLRNEW